MSPKGLRECGNPRCHRTIRPLPAAGRPRLYCDERCKAAARTLRARGSRHPRHREALDRAYATETVEETAKDTDLVLRGLSDPDLGLEQALCAFNRLRSLRRELDDCEAAVAQVCRDLGATTAEVAQAGEVSPSTATRRWPDSSHRLDLVMSRRRKRREAA